jgi:hypothetical protein
MPRKKKLPIVRRVKLETFIGRLGDQIFTVDFTKLNGDERTMNARRKVRSKTKAFKSKITKKPRARIGVHTPSILVFDMQKQAYRHINLETVTSIRAAGKTFKVV